MSTKDLILKRFSEDKIREFDKEISQQFTARKGEKQMAYNNNNKKQAAKPQQEFAKGVNVKVQETKFGDIIKVGINLEQFTENPINEAGFINIELKRAKSGALYAVLQNSNQE